MDCQHPNEEPTGEFDNDGGTLVRCDSCGLVSNIGLAPLTFALTIELGNEEMQTSEDVAAALLRVAATCQMQGMDGPHVIRDINGNTVGSWAVK